MTWHLKDSMEAGDLPLTLNNDVVAPLAPVGLACAPGKKIRRKDASPASASAVKPSKCAPAPVRESGSASGDGLLTSRKFATYIHSWPVSSTTASQFLAVVRRLRSPPWGKRSTAGRAEARAIRLHNPGLHAYFLSVSGFPPAGLSKIFHQSNFRIAHRFQATPRPTPPTKPQLPIRCCSCLSKLEAPLQNRRERIHHPTRLLRGRWKCYFYSD